MKKKYTSWLFPILFFALIAPFTPWLDTELARYCYSLNPNPELNDFSSHPIFTFLYSYALIPAQITGILAILAYLFSFLGKKAKNWRKPSLYLILVMAIGAGFITHTLLKDHWGRPRPRQVIEFGGQQEFRAWYQPNFFDQPEPSKSFPCGHCTMGFYFFSFVFLGRRLNRPWVSQLGWALAILLGIALSLTRMAQGGHFFSDVLMSALVMWLTALVFDKLIYDSGDEVFS